jgi:formate C-acetyltransferase
MEFLRDIYQKNELTKMAKDLYKEERLINRLDGWFLAKEIEMNNDKKYVGVSEELKKAYLLCDVAREIPLFISDNAIFVGTQRDAFAKSYALINPSFTVAGFSGYCDPMAIYNDIEPNEEFNESRISKVRNFSSKSEMVKMLNETSKEYENYTKEVIFFVEQVSGHIIPDFQDALKFGIDKLIEEAIAKNSDFSVL